MARRSMMQTQRGSRKLWQLSIPDIIVIAVIAAISRVINMIGIMLPLPTPIGEWWFIMQFSFLFCVTAEIVRKPFTVIIFTLIQLLVNLLFFGGSPIWAMQNIGQGVIAEIAIIAVWFSSGHYMDNWWSVIIGGLVDGIAAFAIGFGIIMPVFFATVLPADVLAIAGAGFVIAGPVMGLLGFRTGKAIKPLIGK